MARVAATVMARGGGDSDGASGWDSDGADGWNSDGAGGGWEVMILVLGAEVPVARVMRVGGVLLPLRTIFADGMGQGLCQEHH